MTTNLSGQLHAVLDPVITGADLYLESVDVTGPPRKRVVRVTVDLSDGPGGVTSDQLGGLSRTISEVLDDHDDALGGAYMLEVTTPGVDRPLTQVRHFRRAQGRLVTLTTEGGPVTGRVLGVETEGGQDRLRLSEERAKGAPREVLVPVSSITEGRVEVELRRHEEG